MFDIGAEVRVWAVPVAALVIIGIVTWATAGWLLALTPLLLALVIVGLLVAVHHPRAQAWWAGRQDAAHATARLLDDLEERGQRVLPDRTVPGGEADVEHLVVGPGGIFAITSRKWQRRIPVRLLARGLFHGQQSQQQLLHQSRRTAERAGRLLSQSLGEPVTVTPALVIHGPTVPWKVMRIHGVDVLAGRRLRRYIGNRGRTLSTVAIERIVAAMEDRIPPRFGSTDTPRTRSSSQSRA